MPQIKKITDLTAPELDLFSRYSESQLFHINEPKPGIFIAESPNVIERALNAGYEPLAVLIEEKQADDLIPKLFFAYPGASCVHREIRSPDKSHRLCLNPRPALRHEAKEPAVCGGDL